MSTRATPGTGPISMADVRSELGLSGTITLNDSAVRTLAGKASGTISMSDLRGKSNFEIKWSATYRDVDGNGDLCFRVLPGGAGSYPNQATLIYGWQTSSLTSSNAWANTTTTSGKCEWRWQSVTANRFSRVYGAPENTWTNVDGAADVMHYRRSAAGNGHDDFRITVREKADTTNSASCIIDVLEY